MTLLEFIQLRHRFDWQGRGFLSDTGFVENNCFTFPATWGQVVTGLDAAEAYRGVCHSEEEADALVAREGGLVAFAERQLLMIGCERTKTPTRGDVGIVKAPHGVGESLLVGAIKYGPAEKPLWAMIGKVRALVKETEFVAAWRLPC